MVDEAGMAGTRKLAAIVNVAAELGVHVRLMGDHRQLSAVDAGGMFPLFVRHHGAAELDQVFRFKSKDEAAASIMLRDPDTAGDPFAWYKEQGRVIAGTEEQMVQKVYEAWQHDVEVGHSAIMVAATNTQVDQLNKRAQAYRAAAGELHRGRTTRLRDGNNGHEGDLILTRHNNTRIKYNGGADFVRNGDQWRITKIYRDGSLQVSHTANHGSVRLPADYVTANTELGYALTGNRAQGATIEGDSSDDGFQFEGRGHVLLDGSVTRNNAYVMATRAVDGNYLYVAVDDTDTSGVDNLTDHPNQVAMDDVLAQIAANVSTNAAAHDMLRTERERVAGLRSFSVSSTTSPNTSTRPACRTSSEPSSTTTPRQRSSPTPRDGLRSHAPCSTSSRTAPTSTPPSPKPSLTAPPTSSPHPSKTARTSTARWPPRVKRTRRLSAPTRTRTTRRRRRPSRSPPSCARTLHGSRDAARPPPA